jgi:hypothetical protein
VQTISQKRHEDVRFDALLVLMKDRPDRNMTACDYPHPVKLEQGLGLHYKPFRLFRLTPSFAIQPLVREIFFYLASNPRSRANCVKRKQQPDICYAVHGLR